MRDAEFYIYTIYCQGKSDCWAELNCRCFAAIKTCIIIEALRGHLFTIENRN